MQICLCGTIYGGCHRPHCPWPCYRPTPQMERVWLLGCRVLTERLLGAAVAQETHEEPSPARTCLDRLADDGCPHHD